MKNPIDRKYLIDAAAHRATLQQVAIATGVPIDKIIPLCTLWAIHFIDETKPDVDFYDKNEEVPYDCRSGITVIDAKGHRKGRVSLVMNEYQPGTFGVL